MRMFGSVCGNQPTSFHDPILAGTSLQPQLQAIVNLQFSGGSPSLSIGKGGHSTFPVLPRVCVFGCSRCFQIDPACKARLVECAWMGSDKLCIINTGPFSTFSVSSFTILHSLYHLEPPQSFITHFRYYPNSPLPLSPSPQHYHPKTQPKNPNTKIKMQFNIVAVALAALVASAAAQNATITGGSNSTNATTSATPTANPETGSAFNNAVSGGMLGAVVAAGLVLVL
ncbi:hypothetical protein DFP73DRAFT_336709 [Morchella snyderi]|nr:hypothetical protein DFP73DRAFT_336709 [Morchella snyderi]